MHKCSCAHRTAHLTTPHPSQRLPPCWPHASRPTISAAMPDNRKSRPPCITRRLPAGCGGAAQPRVGAGGTAKPTAAHGRRRAEALPSQPRTAHGHTHGLHQVRHRCVPVDYGDGDGDGDGGRLWAHYIHGGLGARGARWDLGCGTQAERPLCVRVDADVACQVPGARIQPCEHGLME